MSEGLLVRPAVREYRVRAVGPAVSTSSPGRLGPGSKCPWGQPAVLCDLGPHPMARSVNQPSWENRACAGGPAVSSSCPGRLVLVAEAPQGRPPASGDSGPGPRARSVDQHSQATPALFQGPRIRRALLGDLGPRPRYPGVDQLSWSNRSCVRWTVGMNSSRGGLGLMFDGLWVLPAVPGDSGTCLRARRVD